jgi:hypothetical protein
MTTGFSSMRNPIRRWWVKLLPTLILTLLAVPSLAMMGFEPVQQTEESIGSAIPEPRAVLLFALGTLLVAWTVRRRRATS